MYKSHVRKCSANLKPIYMYATVSNLKVLVLKAKNSEIVQNFLRFYHIYVHIHVDVA